jgi:hypothetical protein
MEKVGPPYLEITNQWILSKENAKMVDLKL